MEVMNCLKSVQSVFRCRAQAGFMPLKVELLTKLRQDGLDDRCDAFCSQVTLLYSTCLEYLDMWTVPLEELNGFAWMALTERPTWDEVSASVLYLRERKVQVDDSKCFDQLCNLKKFVEASCDGDDFVAQLAHGKWVKYFNSCKNICHQVLDLYSSKQKKGIDGDSPPQSPVKGTKQLSSSPPPPPPPLPGERTLNKRSREDASETDPASKVSKLDKDVKLTSISQSSVSGAPIPVAQHITSLSGNHPIGSMAESGSIDFSSYNPYVSSQMYTSSFMSQEGSQNIQSILAGNAPPPPGNAYSDHIHHSQSTDTSQYPPTIQQTDITYSYPPPPQNQYAAPQSLSHTHSYSSIPNVVSSAGAPYDPYAAPPNPTPFSASSYPPPPVPHPPSQHSYPQPSVPPPQSYGGFYSPASHSSVPTSQLAPPSRLPGFLSKASSYSQSTVSTQNYGQPRNQGNYQKHGKHSTGGQRKDTHTLTEVKITGRSDWNQPK